VADCCRAVDYLRTRPEVDRSRFAVISGNELSLLTAALRPHATHAIATPSLFYKTKGQPSPDGAYRMEEVNDYLRLFPDKASDVERTLSYFDPRFFASSVKTRTLLWGDAEFLAPLTQAIGGEVEVRASARSTYKDGMFQERWLASQFGFADVIVPAHWQG
jgi:cephalosporin-C deacetylase-like acetyl esterase